MDWPQALLDLFDHPLLADVHPQAAPLTADDRRIQKLMGITAWSEAHGGKRPSTEGDLMEKCMARALAALKQEAGDLLAPYDRLHLLS